tara:strand:+ start:540 stop:731 length:192 start_codon:yes stop_codon:yes gene_type:complete
MKIKGPDTSSMDYKYGIFAKIKDGSRGWTLDDIRFWCDRNSVYHEHTDTREELVERIKQAGYK